MKPYLSASGSPTNHGDLPNVQPSVATVDIRPVWIYGPFVGVWNPAPTGGTAPIMEQTPNQAITCNPQSQVMTANDRPIARRVGDSFATGTPLPVCQPQVLTTLQDSQVRPAGVVRSSGDCPFDSWSTTNQVVWGAIPVARNGGDSVTTGMMSGSACQPQVSNCFQHSEGKPAGMARSSDDGSINSQTERMAWPVFQPQVSKHLQNSEVRPFGMGQSFDDRPINIRTMTNQMVWSSLEASSTDFSSGCSQSSDSLTLSLSSSDGSPEGRRKPKKLTNRQIDPKEIVRRSQLTSATTASSGSNASHGSWWSDTAEYELSSITMPTSGTPCGDLENVPDPRENSRSVGQSDDGKEVPKELVHAGQAETKSGVQGMSLEEILKLVPCNEKGFPSSIGSIGHSEHTCKPPCVSFLSRSRCMEGVKCAFCHLAHVSKRPDRGLPGRCRRHWERFKSKIEKNPDMFDVDAVEFPLSISSDLRLKENFKTRMRRHQEFVKLHGSEQPASRSTIVSI